MFVPASSVGRSVGLFIRSTNKMREAEASQPRLLINNSGGVSDDVRLAVRPGRERALQ